MFRLHETTLWLIAISYYTSYIDNNYFISCRLLQSDGTNYGPIQSLTYFMWVVSSQDIWKQVFCCISKDSSLFLTCTDIACAIYNLVPSVIVFRRCLLSQRGEHATPPATSVTSAGSWRIERPRSNSVLMCLWLCLSYVVMLVCA